MSSPGGEAGRRDSQQRYSVRGGVHMVMLEQGNRKHHIRNGVSNSQFTFLPKGTYSDGTAPESMSHKETTDLEELEGVEMS